MPHGRGRTQVPALPVLYLASADPRESNAPTATAASTDTTGGYLSQAAQGSGAATTMKALEQRYRQQQAVKAKERAIAEAEIPIAFVQKYAKSQDAVESLFIELPFFCAFLLVFLFFVIIGDDTEISQSISQGILGPLYTRPITQRFANNASGFEKTFSTLALSEDFFIWADRSLAPRIWGATSAVEGKPLSSVRWIGSGLVFGAVRVRVMNADSNDCVPKTAWMGEKSSFRCYPNYRYQALTTNYINNVTACPFSFTGDMESTYDPCTATHTFDFPLNMSVAAAQSMLSQRLRGPVRAPVISVDRTRFVAISFATFHPPTEQFNLLHLTLEISKTGGIVPGMRSMPFHFFAMDRNVPSLVFLVCFLVVVLLQAYQVFRSAVRAKQQDALLDWILTPWNLLDLTNLGAFVALFVIRFWLISECINTTLAIGAIVTDTAEYRSRLETIATLAVQQRLCNGINTVLTTVRILKFCDLTDRLGMILRTIETAVGNLVNLLIIFVTLLVAFSLSAGVLWGNTMLAFSDMSFSMSSMLRMLLGDWDYESMRDQNGLLTGVLFWAFLIICLFTLLNLMVAVLLDAFAQECRQRDLLPLSESVIQLIESVVRFFKRVWARGPVQYFLSSVWLPCMPETTGSDRLKRKGRLQIVYNALRDYRLSLAKAVTSSEFLQNLSSVELEAQMPSPRIRLLHVKRIILASDEGDEVMAFLTPEFLEDFWLEAVIAFSHTAVRRSQMVQETRRMAVQKILKQAVSDVIHGRGAPAQKGGPTALPSRYADIFGGVHQNAEYIAGARNDLEEAQSKLRDVAGIVAARNPIVSDTHSDLCSAAWRQSQAEAASGSGPGGASSDLHPPVSRFFSTRRAKLHAAFHSLGAPPDGGTADDQPPQEKKEKK